MAKLSASARKNIPKSKMGLPGNATKKGGAVPGTYPMEDRRHAGLAKAFAKKNATPAQRAKIDAKADKILGTKKKKGK